MASRAGGLGVTVNLLIWWSCEDGTLFLRLFLTRTRPTHQRNVFLPPTGEYQNVGDGLLVGVVHWADSKMNGPVGVSRQGTGQGRRDLLSES